MNIRTLIETQFANELDETLGSWRIFRRSTLIDLLMYTFFLYEKHPSDDNLISIFNIIQKIKINDRLGELLVNEDLSSQLSQLEEQKENIFNLYAFFVSELLESINYRKIEDLARNKLKSKISYLKVLSDLRLTEHQDESLTEISIIIYLILNQKV